MGHLIDTCVLIDYPGVFNYYDDIIIHIRVVKELDRLKDSSNRTVATKAVRALRALKEKRGQYLSCFEEPVIWNDADEVLLYAAERNGYTLVTNDIGLYMIAGTADYDGLSVEEYHESEDFYSGVRYLDLPFNDPDVQVTLDHLLDNRIPLDGMSENQFLIVRNTSDLLELRDGSMAPAPICELQVKEGRLEYLNKGIGEVPSFESLYEGKIKPLNPEQKCLFALLQDQSLSIVSGNGSYGVGKSYIMLNYALSQPKKLIYVPNNSFVKDTREIGAVPGDLFAKEALHIGTLIDRIGDVELVQSLVESGSIEIVPISIMRGRNIENGIIYVNEAQNLTSEHIQLLLGRCGKDTRIFFDGDIKQTDSQKFREYNGLAHLTKLRHSSIYSKLFGCVKLLRTERSETAMAAAYLDELDKF